MPELYTVSLERGLFDAMIGRLRTAPGKPAPRNTLDVVTLKGAELPTLAGYDLGGSKEIDLSVPFGGAPAALFAVAASLWSHAKCLRAGVHLAPSGRLFDVEDGEDLKLTFGWDPFNSYVEIAVGKYSDGYKDFAVRASLFDVLLRCANLTDEIRIVVENGVLRLVSESFVRLSVGFATEFTAERASGKRFYRLNGAQFDGTNFSTLGIYCPTIGDAHSIARRMLTEGFGGTNAVALRLGMVVAQEKYESLRTVVKAVLPSASWTIMFSAKQRYGVDDISEAFDNLSGFLITLYTAKIPKVGAVDVAVNHDEDGCTRMSFIFEKCSSRAYDAVRAFAAELAGGRDVIESPE
jgi:hypothetical protein